MAAVVIILVGALLIAGVIRQALRERQTTDYIDLRERLAPYDDGSTLERTR